ncbi:MAG: D-cysteine desulfhydrase family protein [Chthonomonas sp.]|nr:D-cysteine desulfhydrase family protein [Chthonomonas sp.]
MVSPIPLIVKPTPCHRLERASQQLGIDLWIKRDDLTGFALGGNKGRKLEYLMAQAMADGCDTIVTCGATESNFIRQLAAACAVCGIRCVAVVMETPYEDGFAPPTTPHTGIGNPTITQLFGADIHVLPNGTWDALFAAMDAKSAELQRGGANVHTIPIGGSSGLGAYAFLQAADELPACDVIVCPTSSGSTLAGLQLAFEGFATRVIGIAADPEPALKDDVLRVANELRALLELPEVDASTFDLRREFVGPGYGVPSAEGDAALRWLAQTEGILLDPIYSAKAFAGLLDMAKRGDFNGETVVFWHTGGIPALWAFC